MKRIVFILSLALTSSSLSAQSIFQTLFSSTNEQGQLGSMTEITGLVINNDCCTVNKFIQHVTSYEMPSDWLWSHCTPDMCLPTGDSLGYYYLMPSDTGQVSVRFYVGNTPGSAEMNIRFADRDNLSDYQDVQFTVWASTSDIQESNWQLLIYPNPVDNFINIEGDISDLTCDLFDIRGKKLLSSLNLEGRRINISNIQSGVYLLALQKPEERLIKRIIIQ